MRKSAVLFLLLFACRRETPTPQQPPPQPAAATETTATEAVTITGGKDLTIQVPPVSLYVAKVHLGSTKAADGTAAEDKSKFAPGEKVYLTMWLKESPEGLQTSVKWYDRGQLVHEEQRDMKGEKVVTFALEKKLKPGAYRVVGYWGGNIAAERVFTVE